MNINLVELASNLADRELKMIFDNDKELNVIFNFNENIRYFDEIDDCFYYTEKAQDIFNNLYDEFYTIITKCKE